MFKMQGIVPPMLTPFKENGELDRQSLATLANFLSDRVDGLFITGSYGAGAMMDLQERKEVVEITKKVVDGRVPIVVMVGSTNSKTSCALAEHAAKMGVEAVAAVGPYYFHHNEDNLLKFFGDILNTVDHRVPVYVYNNPKFQGYEMSLDLLKKMKAIGIAGIKDATFDIILHATYHRLLGDKDFDIALGTEAMWLSACVLGTKAFIPGLGNVFPEICRKMYREGIAGELTACRATQFKVNRLREIMYLARSTQLAVYAMLEIRGIIKAYPRAPFIPASTKEKAEIKKELENLMML